MTDVLKMTIYVASGDRADLVTAWDAIRVEFGEYEAPGTLVGVVVLGYPGQLVEIEAVAAAGVSGLDSSPGGDSWLQRN